MRGCENARRAKHGNAIGTEGGVRRCVGMQAEDAVAVQQFLVWFGFQGARGEG